MVFLPTCLKPILDSIRSGMLLLKAESPTTVQPSLHLLKQRTTQFMRLSSIQRRPLSYGAITILIILGKVSNSKDTFPKCWLACQEPTPTLLDHLLTTKSTTFPTMKLNILITWGISGCLDLMMYEKDLNRIRKLKFT